ncbi:hypothetical protein BDV98DRAFT_556783, partial [Pterulicium gracile]
MEPTFSKNDAVSHFVNQPNFCLRLDGVREAEEEFRRQLLLYKPAFDRSPTPHNLSLTLTRRTIMIATTQAFVNEACATANCSCSECSCAQGECQCKKCSCA